MQEEIYDALYKKYEAMREEAKVNIELYFRNPVAVADHPNLIETMDGLIKQYNDVIYIEDIMKIDIQDMIRSEQESNE